MSISATNLAALFAAAQHYVHVCTTEPEPASINTAACEATARLSDARIAFRLHIDELHIGAAPPDRAGIISALKVLAEGAGFTNDTAAFLQVLVGSGLPPLPMHQVLAASVLDQMRTKNLAFLDLLHEALTGEPLAGSAT